jgi:beta-glucosidase
MDPLVHGNYPTVMRKNVGSRLPVFTDEDSRRVKGSYDFIGLNHYATIFVQADTSQWENQLRDYMHDVAVKIPEHFSGSLNKALMQKKVAGFPPSPWGLSELLDHVKEYYGNPLILIHENGDPEFVNPTTPEIEDDFRINYLEQYLEALQLSIRNGSNTQGYFVWSLMDCFEFLAGYTNRYGLYGVDFSDDERPRYQRNSARWYAKFLGGQMIRNKASREDAFDEFMKLSL